MPELRHISTADADLLDALLVLNNEAVPAVNELDAESLRRLIDESAHAIAVMQNDDPIGLTLLFTAGASYESENYVWFEQRARAAGTDFLYIDRVIIADGHRSAGIGAQLYKHVFELATAEGRAEVTCEVNLDPPNPRSQAFHAREGFSEVGQLVTKGGAYTVVLLAAPVPAASAPRPSKKRPRSLGTLTQAVHAGNVIDAGSGALRIPIVMANSYALPDDPGSMDWSGTDIRNYTRSGAVNQDALQHKLAVLEHGEDAVVLASGVAALHAVFFTFLKSGDHAIIADQTYEATWRLFSELLPERYGIEATFVDATDPDAVRAAVRPTTRLVHIETPANPTTTVTDVEAIAAITREHRLLLSVDATFSTPLLLRPLDLGADLVVHSLTKYINGHGDAMGGAVIGRADLIKRIKNDAMVDVGGTVSPFNAWLIMRGSVTLPLRMRQHCASAQSIAERLEADPRIAFVAYPGLASHPQHDVAKRTMPNGYGGMMAFALDADRATQNAFVANLEIITSAVSLGHDETLIVYVDGSGGRAATYPQAFRDYGHLRLSVGLEETEDLIDDLFAALDAVMPIGAPGP